MDEDGKTPLHLAIMEVDGEWVDRFRGRAEDHSRNQKGHEATAGDHSNISDVINRGDTNNCSPLDLAATLGLEITTQKLLEMCDKKVIAQMILRVFTIAILFACESIATLSAHVGCRSYIFQSSSNSLSMFSTG